jgi:dephospho-CoA kinase
VISIAVTGNLGCGKTTVARLLAGDDGEVVDADALVHELLAPGGVAVDAVLAEFPGAAAVGGAVSRPALARAIFADPQRRRCLERLLHPLVVAESRRRLADARSRGVPLVVSEVPLLYESVDAGTAPGSLERFDAVVAVTCDPDVQWRRLALRHGLEGVLPQERREELEARLLAQLPQDEKARRADRVVDNSGDVERTAAQARVIRSELLGGAERRD